MSAPEQHVTGVSGRWLVVALSLLMTLLNSFKPMTVDDAHYYYRARQIAKNPLDPFGDRYIYHFGDREIPATAILCPPVFCAWWALGLRLLGDHEYLWKWWLLPFALLLVASLERLLRRFATGLEKPVLSMTVLSAAILPGFDFMLDIPCLALGLAAVACFLRAADEGSFRRALLAGLVAGLAMQTKYTGVTAVAAICIYGTLSRRWKLALAAAMVASCLFVAWEIFIYARYGTSQFLHTLAWRRAFVATFGFGDLALALVTVTGCVAPALVPLGLIAAGARTRTMVIAMGAIAAAYVTFALAPARYAEFFKTAMGQPRLALHQVTVDVIGIALWGVAAVALWQAYFRRPRELQRNDWFLLLWLAAELVFYFPLSPFPAVRRVLGVIVVLTLLLARAAARGRWPGRLTQAYTAAAFSAGVGVLFWGIDLYGAQVQKTALGEAEACVRCRNRAGTTWFVGGSGFYYYGDRAGFRPVIPNRSRLEPGDFVVLPRRQAGVVVFRTTFDEGKMELVKQIALGDALPVATQLGYYYGLQPLQRSEIPQTQVDVYRVTQGYVPIRTNMVVDY